MLQDERAVLLGDVMPPGVRRIDDLIAQGQAAFAIAAAAADSAHGDAGGNR